MVFMCFLIPLKVTAWDAPRTTIFIIFALDEKTKGHRTFCRRWRFSSWA